MLDHQLVESYPSSSLAQLMRVPLHHLLATSHIAVILDKT